MNEKRLYNPFTYTKKIKDVIDILKTPSYVSLIEGPSGIGKTYLGLSACAGKEGCVFISYAEQESSLRKKMNKVAQILREI
jgi:SpoVK/Ycf46/Vps4 family AAA+-type ATPase